jgi:hypothetical protein
MPKYALLLGGGEEQWSKFSPEQAQQMMEKYYTWAGQLATKPWLRGGEQLNPGGRVLTSSANGQVVDGPYTETKDVISGYVIVEAPDYDAAMEMGKDIPSLQHSGWVIVRQIDEMQPNAQTAEQWDAAAQRLCPHPR